jgi:aryl-alcohol dehydrogenase (NADP+)
MIERALALGITLFDTCNFYSGGESERVLGAALQAVTDREKVVIATKLGNPMGTGPNERGYSRKHIMKAVDDSLRRLDTDYVDLLQTHIWSEPVHVEEVIEAFHDLVVSGKARYVGLADMPVWRVAEFVYKARARGLREIVSIQHHYNLVWRGAERELTGFCEHESLGQLAYSPLARGFLADPAGHDRDTERARTDGLSRESYGRESDATVAAEVQRVAADRGISPAAVALAWVRARAPFAIPLIGATRVDQLEMVPEALGCALTGDELAALEAPYEPRMRYGH